MEDRLRALIYSLDTHALFWYEVGDPQLSPAATAVFREAQEGRAILVLHPIVLAEFFFILAKFGLEAEFENYMDRIVRNPIYRIEPIAADDLKRLHHVTEIPEMHDRLIAIQAIRLEAVLVTRDRTIQASTQLRWIW
jgi:PIN domain nuclease of toxin-antitoxin system